MAESHPELSVRDESEPVILKCQAECDIQQAEWDLGSMAASGGARPKTKKSVAKMLEESVSRQKDGALVNPSIVVDEPPVNDDCDKSNVQKKKKKRHRGNRKRVEKEQETGQDNRVTSLKRLAKGVVDHLVLERHFHSDSEIDHKTKERRTRHSSEHLTVEYDKVKMTSQQRGKYQTGQGRNQHSGSYRGRQNSGMAGNNSGTPRGKQQRQAGFQPYETYWPTDQVSHGLKRGELIQGTLRINPKNYQDAYMPDPNGHSDIYISGMRARNRALNGDVVAVQLLAPDEWKVLEDDLKFDAEKPSGSSNNSGHETLQPSVEEAVDGVATMAISTSEATSVAEGQTEMPHTPNTKVTPDKKKQTPKKPPNSARNSPRFTSVKSFRDEKPSVAKKLFPNNMSDDSHAMKYLMKTGKVVAVVEKKHSRCCTGNIKLMADNNREKVLFSPMDYRAPRIHIPMSDCPKDFAERPEDHSKTLFIARIEDWLENSSCPSGRLARSLGEAGAIEPETEGMLVENGVEFGEFSQQALDCLPKDLPWTIPVEEISLRRDFREECVFTIDPATARDLDDALSCKRLDNGCYEIGVHIADVSYFVDQYSALDKVAASRATSVYLVQKVIPMLPRLLCEQLCSLNPDEDRLAFSVVWEMDENGKLKSEWFGRTVIRSCVKLSYDHAQGFIEKPDREWKAEELPPISEGFTINDIKSRVLILNKIAQARRKKRFDEGALRLDQVKLSFTLDKDTGMPNGYRVYQQRDSNRLIEEFMLLANMAVAHKIYKFSNDKALLRRHPAPQVRMMDKLVDQCSSIGVPIDGASSGALHESLSKYVGEDDYSLAKTQVLTVLCSKPMQWARYFCTGVLEDEHLFRHYALNVPFYTHFTSPIRRYPDIMVHRLLAASLGLCPVTDQSCEDIQKQADHCNDRKSASKVVQEMSSDLFFSLFVKECGPIEEVAMVMGVMDRSFDILVLKLGVVKRVYTEKLPLASKHFVVTDKKPQLTLVWKADGTHPKEVKQVIAIFTMVHSILTADEDQLKWSATIKHPDDTSPSLAVDDVDAD